LEHQGRPASDGTGFYFFMLLFMGSMVGLAMAQDLILVFVFWDLTAIASYYLIGFDHHKEESRASALMALLVTGVTAVLLLIGRSSSTPPTGPSPSPSWPRGSSPARS
jgi:multicomponent Na+:H+ antiporter subunit A